MSSSQSITPTPSFLLNLPAELQLSIYELVIFESIPLLLNCACNSSYYANYEQMDRDEAAWESGEKHPPIQPALTKVCRQIRADAIKMFYKYNDFRAHYCYAVNRLVPIGWLERIGPENRSYLQRLHFYDGNPHYDMDDNEEDVRRFTTAVEKMGASVKKVSDGDCCCHHVTFPPVQGVQLHEPAVSSDSQKLAVQVASVLRS